VGAQIEGMSKAGTQAKVRASSTGLHLFDRSTGLNVLLDELAIPSDRWARAPRYVSIALTNACDLRCPYCYAPKRGARLHIDQVLKWIRELDLEGCLGVGFGGGEPTLFPDLVQLCRAADSQTNLAVSFTTHAHHLSQPMAAGLSGHVHFVRVSVDGVGETYSRLRGRSFDHLRSQLGLVRSIAPFGINVVVNEDTVHQLDDIAAFAVEEGAAEFVLLPEHPTTGRAGASQEVLDVMEKWTLRQRFPLRLAVSAAGVTDGIPIAEPFREEHPLEAHAHVDAFGIVRRDAFQRHGVPVVDSIMDALAELQTTERDQ
jgi:MoaA/NifB/PqqE/SkfB family radical SAM enzyme